MMSRFESVVQAPGLDRRTSHPPQRIPCGRCYAVIEYGRGTEWSVVSELSNEHWKMCPGKPHVRPVCVTRAPTSPLDAVAASTSQVALNRRSSSSLVGESVTSSNSTWISAGCERKRRTLEQRKLELEQDEYAKNVTTKSVVCGGCHKEISLDKRSKYYPGLWLKHRGKCPGIEKLERAKGKIPQVLNGTRPSSCNAVVSTVGDNGYRDVVRFGAERYEDHGVSTAPQIVRHYESEDLSSEDEEEEEELPPEPFPALNGVFYRSERSSNLSDEWAYRYATEEEINANFFHGQDEPYPHPATGTRPFTYLDLQDGGRYETSCWVMKSRDEQTASHADDFRSTREQGKPSKDIAPHHTLPRQTDPFTR